jgi:ribosome biogenesis protein UTP30
VKKLYKEYKDRKELLKAHSHFICDANIMGQLYNLLGKVFSEKNNYPIPMNYGSPTSLADGIKKVVDSTYMHLKGKSITIRFGHTSMRSNDVVENIKVGLEFALQKIQNGWKDIQSIHVKTAYSSALPVYSKNKSESLEFIKSQVKGGESSAKAKGESIAKVKESAAKVKESAAKVKESAAKVKEEGSAKTVTSKKIYSKETLNEKEPAKKKGGKDTRPVSAQSPVGTKIVDKKNKKSKK